VFVTLGRGVEVLVIEAMTVEVVTGEVVAVIVCVVADVPVTAGAVGDSPFSDV